MKGEFCACENDWTDGTGICQECKLPRITPTARPAKEPAPQTFEEKIQQAIDLVEASDRTHHNIGRDHATMRVMKATTILRSLLAAKASSPAVTGGESDPNTLQQQEYRVGLDKVTDARNSLVAMEIPDLACSDMRDRIVMVFDILMQVLLEHFPLIAESSQPLIKDVRGKE